MALRSTGHLLIVVALAGAAAGVVSYRMLQGEAQQDTSATFASPSPRDPLHVALPQLDGEPRSLADFTGPTLVVNFWATWCEPCREEMPALMTLQREFAGSGVRFVGVAVDDHDAVKAFAAQIGLSYPTLYGQAQALTLAGHLGNDLGALPYTVVLDGSGQMLHQKLGRWFEADARAVLRQLATAVQ